MSRLSEWDDDLGEEGWKTAEEEVSEVASIWAQEEKLMALVPNTSILDLNSPSLSVTI